MSAHISIYDGARLLGVIDGDPRTAWLTARAVVNVLAHEGGRARVEISHREWFRTPGRSAYQRCGFRAVNTFRGERS